MATWRVWSYDVWGNAEEGYEVNDRYEIGTVKMPDEPTDKQILKAAKDAGLLKSTVRLSQLTIEGDEFTIRLDASRDGYPLGEMERDE